VIIAPWLEGSPWNEGAAACTATFAPFGRQARKAVRQRCITRMEVGSSGRRRSELPADGRFNERVEYGNLG
jgi:hypothetical protein